LLGNGDGTFQPAVPYSTGGVEAVSVAIADVNRDGKLDLLVANACGNSSNCQPGSGTNPGPGTVSVLLGNGDGTFQAAASENSGGYGAYSVAVADVNGDGNPDLVVDFVFNTTLRQNTTFLSYLGPITSIDSAGIMLYQTYNVVVRNLKTGQTTAYTTDMNGHALSVAPPAIAIPSSARRNFMPSHSRT